MAVREPHSSGGAARAGTDETSPDAPRKRRRWIAAIVLVAAAAIAVYINTFGAELTLDDLFIIEKDRLVTRWADVPKVFASAYWTGPGEDVPDSSKGNLYRPFAVLTYAAQFAVHGVRPSGYHVVNVLLHALASVLLLLLVRAILDDARVAFAAALLFAVHPIHTEAVSNVVGRAEVLALVGTLACALFFARALRQAELAKRGATATWVAASVGAYAVGCFSKETGVVAPAVILAWEVFVPARRALLRLRPWAIGAFACYSGVLASYLALRSRSAPSVEMHAGFVGVDTLHRVATALRVCLEYVGLLVAPVRLSADYWTDDVPVARGFADRGVIAALIVLALACALVAWSRRRLPGVGWGLASFALALLPVSNLLFPIGVLKAERILYTPSAGFLIAAAALLPLAWSRPRLRTAAWALVGVLALAYAVRTIVRNRDWHDNRTLALATLAHSPNAPVFHGILGRWYRDHGQNPQAREHLLRVAELLPNNWLSLYHVGNIELDMGMPAEAVEHYRRGLALDPKSAFMLHNLSQALRQLHRDDEAMDTLERLVELKPSDRDAWQNLLSLYVSTGQLTRGEKRADEAVRLYPDAVPVLWNAAVLYERLGRVDDARRLFARAHELDPKLR